MVEQLGSQYDRCRWPVSLCKPNLGHTAVAQSTLHTAAGLSVLQCIKYCLENRFGFKAPGCIVVLTDDQKHPDFTSTRANILRGIQWLMMDQRPGDSLFFHFSGEQLFCMSRQRSSAQHTHMR